MTPKKPSPNTKVCTAKAERITAVVIMSLLALGTGLKELFFNEPQSAIRNNLLPTVDPFFNATGVCPAPLNVYEQPTPSETLPCLLPCLLTAHKTNESMLNTSLPVYYFNESWTSNETIFNNNTTNLTCSLALNSSELNETSSELSPCLFTTNKTVNFVLINAPYPCPDNELWRYGDSESTFNKASNKSVDSMLNDTSYSCDTNESLKDNKTTFNNNVVNLTDSLSSNSSKLNETSSDLPSNTSLNNQSTYNISTQTQTNCWTNKSLFSNTTLPTINSFHGDVFNLGTKIGTSNLSEKEPQVNPKLENEKDTESKIGYSGSTHKSGSAFQSRRIKRQPICAAPDYQGKKKSNQPTVAPHTLLSKKTPSSDESNSIQAASSNDEASLYNTASEALVTFSNQLENLQYYVVANSRDMVTQSIFFGALYLASSPDIWMNRVNSMIANKWNQVFLNQQELDDMSDFNDMKRDLRAIDQEIEPMMLALKKTQLRIIDLDIKATTHVQKQSLVQQRSLALKLLQDLNKEQLKLIKKEIQINNDVISFLSQHAIELQVSGSSRLDRLHTEAIDLGNHLDKISSDKDNFFHEQTARG